MGMQFQMNALLPRDCCQRLTLLKFFECGRR
jgi:hypothetical protein